MYRFNLVPDAPENVRIIQVNVNNATVTWNKPSKNQIRGVIKKYIVQVRMLKIKQSDEDELIYEKEVVEVASTSCPIFYLLPDKNYTVQVAIENEKNRGPFGYNSFTTPPGKVFKSFSKKDTVSACYICTKNILNQ